MITERPKRPEGELMCEACGYRAPESEYKHTCPFAVMIIIWGAGMILSIITMTVYGILEACK